MTNEEKNEIEEIIRKNLGEIKIPTSEELQILIDGYSDGDDEINQSIYGQRFFICCDEEHIKTRL